MLDDVNLLAHVTARVGQGGQHGIHSRFDRGRLRVNLLYLWRDFGVQVRKLLRQRVVVGGIFNLGFLRLLLLDLFFKERVVTRGKGLLIFLPGTQPLKFIEQRPNEAHHQQESRDEERAGEGLADDWIFFFFRQPRPPRK